MDKIAIITDVLKANENKLGLFGLASEAALTEIAKEILVKLEITPPDGWTSADQPPQGWRHSSDKANYPDYAFRNVRVLLRGGTEKAGYHLAETWWVYDWRTAG